VHRILLRALDYANLIILIYFIVANGVYTMLMAISLYAVTLHSRFAAHTGYSDIADSPATPPITLIVPAFNEEGVITTTINALLRLEYPEKEIVVVDDGSTDGTLRRLISEFNLKRMDLIYRERIPSKAPWGYFVNPEIPGLVVLAKENGGKAEALNTGLNMCRSPFFCTVDADSIVERKALLRLMAPIMHANVNTVVSGGLVRIANGCTMVNGEVTEIGLPATWLERCQVVEYIRTFLFGRPAWNFLKGNFITSGAFCLIHRESAILAGGFGKDTVTEDIDMIAALHTFYEKKGWASQMVFTTDPVCWTECPRKFSMLARQRRRWQLGLVQTAFKHDRLIFNWKQGRLGLLSMPFHAYVEAFGSVVETLGLFILPLSLIVGAMPLSLFLLIMFLAIGYGTLLSVISVLLAEATIRRYPKPSEMFTLVLYAFLENFGYRQIVSAIRAQGVFQFLFGKKRWEVVTHKGVEA
jgi:cellulose synthase/poly-beta-1,6-N-acetylglucosamine synthase-like glycosyltransferase